MTEHEWRQTLTLAELAAEYLARSDDDEAGRLALRLQEWVLRTRRLRAARLVEVSSDDPE